MADLSEESRKLAQANIESMLNMLTQCEDYLRRYASGDTNLGKCLGFMYYTQEALVKTGEELGKLQGEN
jgi:hypothetical protein